VSDRRHFALVSSTIEMPGPWRAGRAPRSPHGWVYGVPGISIVLIAGALLTAAVQTLGSGDQVLRRSHLIAACAFCAVQSRVGFGHQAFSQNLVVPGIFVGKRSGHAD
jgi:hypothetical protein